jgi:hypothetical protein
MKIEEWKLGRIIPYKGNPRNRSQVAVEKVATSIREFGVCQPIVVDENGVILAGHTRREAAVLLKMTSFPVYVAAGLTEQQKRAYRIADNRTNEENTWNIPALQLEVVGLDGIFTGLDLDIIDLPRAPATVAENIEKLKTIKRVGNKKVEVEGDTERYLVIVFSDRAAREKCCEEMGLAKDERYISASILKLRLTGLPEAHHAVSGPRHTGAHV